MNNEYIDNSLFDIINTDLRNSYRVQHKKHLEELSTCFNTLVVINSQLFDTVPNSLRLIYNSVMDDYNEIFEEEMGRNRVMETINVNDMISTRGVLPSNLKPGVFSGKMNLLKNRIKMLEGFITSYNAKRDKK